MDYSDYSRLPSEHRLLNLLMQSQEYATSKNIDITRRDIETIALSFFRDRDLATDEKIIISVKAAMKDIAKMTSPDTANKVIACASHLINILQKDEESREIQTRLRGEIKILDFCQAKINDLFSLKSALVKHKDLMPILDDDNFINAIRKLRTLSDSVLEIMPSTLLSLVHLWKNPKGQQTLKKFIEDASRLKKASIQNLAKNQVTVNLAVNFDELKKSKLSLNISCQHSSDFSNFGELRRFFDQIFKNTLITDLNKEELLNLYNLYQACHSFVSINPNPRDLWESIKPKSSSIEPDDKRHKINGMFPEQIASVLDLCEDQALCPRLCGLNFAQKLALVEEAFQIALKRELKF